MPEVTTLDDLLYEIVDRQTTLERAWTELKLQENQDVSSTASPTFTALTISGLTAGRVVYTGVGGLLSSDAGFAYNAATDTATLLGGLSAATLTATGLTSGRVAVVSTGGLLSDDSDLTFSGATLNATRVGIGTGAGTPSLDGQLNIGSTGGNSNLGFAVSGARKQSIEYSNANEQFQFHSDIAGGYLWHMAGSTATVGTLAFYPAADNARDLGATSFYWRDIFGYRFLAKSSVTMGEGADIVLGTATGTKIGTATNQKLGFFNATPVVRPAAFTQTYATATLTHANPTAVAFPAGGVGTAAGGWSTAANRDLAIARFTALIADVANVKQVVNQVIDYLQSIGLFA